MKSTHDGWSGSWLRLSKPALEVVKSVSVAEAITRDLRLNMIRVWKGMKWEVQPKEQLSRLCEKKRYEKRYLSIYCKVENGGQRDHPTDLSVFRQERGHLVPK